MLYSQGHNNSFDNNLFKECFSLTCKTVLFLRFYGRIAENNNNHEASTLEAIKENASGLSRISGERIWTELKKILEGNFAGDLMEIIIDCGCSEHIGKNPFVSQNANQMSTIELIQFLRFTKST